ncbi:MAG: hypothetical protein Q8M19_15830 [Reyranella sp.]|uniref:hypothetical protein n=1 Tax=Reyranella sp. TaxID=1929291 RepID=UPI001210B07B|nr:hypothetical protein [Reyranella sp.]MDP2332156.1 hypothetical protein [Reyranella sp.]TAJ41404.1 MAG: hypothetical protein EPO55_05575 [Reyranella sp.]
MSVISLLLLTLPATAGPSRSDEREAAVVLFKRSLYILGAAAYCDKRIGRNPELIEAAAAWNKRNIATMEQIIAVLKATGDLSKDEKDQLDKNGLVEVRTAMKSKTDCDRHRADLEGQKLELATNPNTRDPTRAVQGASLVQAKLVWVILSMDIGQKSPVQMTFRNPDRPQESMDECRKSLKALEPELIKAAREKEPMLKSAKFVRAECILSTDDPLRPK